jgi:hypothetical protein
MRHILETRVVYGARSGNRTRIPFRMRDFKSLASTSFAIRARTVMRDAQSRRRTITSHPSRCNPNGRHASLKPKSQA